MINLILTLDYELFGDGSGNVFKHIIKPTDRLLNICNKYNIKITIFFEVLEYLKIKEACDSGIDMGYGKNPAKAIDKQIRSAYKHGHDIQLHLHPQWLNANYNNRWIVDNTLWRLPEVTKANSGYSISELFKLGKNTIEKLLRPIDKNYKCNIFRSGGYNIQPSQKIIKAMKENGFIADSSVYPGGYIDSNLSKYDYTSVSKDIPYWKTSTNNVIKKSDSNGGIIELPVFALPMYRFKKFDLQRIKVKLQNRAYSKEQYSQKIGNKSLFQKFAFYFQKESTTWDYSLFNFRKMKNFYNEANKIVKKSDYKNHPIILIGHTKELFFFKNLINFLEYSHSNHSNFYSLSKYIAHFIE